MVDHDAEQRHRRSLGLAARRRHAAAGVSARSRSPASICRGPDVSARLAPFGTATADGWPVTRVIFDDPLPAHARPGAVAHRGRAGDRRRAGRGHVGAADRPAGLHARRRLATDNGWDVPLPPPRVAQPSDPPGFQSGGYPVLLVEIGRAESGLGGRRRRW